MMLLALYLQCIIIHQIYIIGYRVKAFFFGESCAPLLGVYHPAKLDVDRFEGIVLCYPFGQEYMRVHRAYNRLATMLSNKGFHVLRFDYRGTGDSAGDLKDMTPDDWIDDITIAIQELKDMAGLTKVGLIGLQLGALLAAKVVSYRADLSKLILWDPVITGKEYIDTLKSHIVKKQLTHNDINFVDLDGHLHFRGYMMSTSFQSVLNTMNLYDETPANVERILQVTSHETAHFNELRKTWQVFSNYDYMHTPAPHDWNSSRMDGSIMLPYPILQAINSWV